MSSRHIAIFGIGMLRRRWTAAVRSFHGKTTPVQGLSSARTGFFQDPPELGNQYDDDAALVSLVRRLLPQQVREAMNADAELHRFGARVVAPDIIEACDDAETNTPRHIATDAWGRRVDRLITAQGWKTMKRIAAEEGLVALAYDRTHGEYARVYQFAKLFLFAPSSAVFTCPLAMADGAARLIEGLPTKTRALEHAYERLLSRDPSLAWTSGQWMTERTGGSDVSGTETIAVPHDDNRFRLHGFKWFSSATDSEMTLLLARVQDSPKLSLFFAHIHTDPSKTQLNGVRIQRLKPKLGTRALPTAELELDGMDAELIGTPGRGVATIATMLNLTRVHTAVNAVAFFRRALAIADSYATKRSAFGKHLAALPLHKKTLWDLHTSYRLCLHLVFHTVAILGRQEAASRGGAASADETALLRVLTPLVKAWGSKESLAGIGECLEAMGGAGYMEDVGIARLQRDCQAQTIWEGTTNVLALDLRKLLTNDDAKYRMAWKAFVDGQLEDVPSSPSKTAVQRRVQVLIDDRLQHGTMYEEAFARDVLVDMAQTTASVLVLAHATATGDALDWQFAVQACVGQYPTEVLQAGE